MNLAGLQALYHYNTYANQLLLESVAQLDDAAFTQEISPSHGSVRTLLYHLLKVEAYFLSRCYPATHLFEQDEALTLADLRIHWQQLRADQAAFFSAADEATISRSLEVPLGDHTFRLTVWQLLIQAFVHATHHRGELSILLSELGQPLPTLDPIVQFVKESGQPWPWE